MPYYLDNAFLLDDPWITVVGCGGTGRLRGRGPLPPLPGAQGHHRPGRPRPGGAPQPAAPEFLRRGRREVQEPGSGRPAGAGLPKAARLLGLPIQGRTTTRSNGHSYPGLPNYGDSLIIGCADNAAARRAMAECLPGDPRRWLIDAGNDTNWGQVLVGNVAEPVTLDEPPFTGETCHLAPALLRSSAPTC